MFSTPDDEVTQHLERYFHALSGLSRSGWDELARLQASGRTLGRRLTGLTYFPAQYRAVRATDHRLHGAAVQRLQGIVNTANASRDAHAGAMAGMHALLWKHLMPDSWFRLAYQCVEPVIPARSVLSSSASASTSPAE